MTGPVKQNFNLEKNFIPRLKKRPNAKPNANDDFLDYSLPELQHQLNKNDNDLPLMMIK